MRRKHKTTAPDTTDYTDDAGRPTRRVARLRAELAEARDLHGLADDPHLNNVQVERMRASTTRGMWFFLALGLGFTTTGVHDALAGHLVTADPMWWGAWLVEPGLAGILVTLMRWEADTIARGVDITSGAITRLKRLLLGTTLGLNVWSAFRPSGGHGLDAGLIAVHVVIPLVVYLLAEVMPAIQQHSNHARRATPAPSDRQPLDVREQRPGAVAVAEDAPAAVARLRLPGHLHHALTLKAAEVTSQGRALTAQDVQAALNVSGGYAARIAAQLAGTPTNEHVNGHAVTA
jgi:uncharacterized membrane protein